jgi:hypothetical protein
MQNTTAPDIEQGSGASYFIDHNRATKNHYSFRAHHLMSPATALCNSPLPVFRSVLPSSRKNVNSFKKTGTFFIQQQQKAQK